MLISEYKQLIEDYDHSANYIQSRIDELTDRISGRAELKDGESTKTLIARRYHLYREYADMRLQISQMQEYVNTLNLQQIQHDSIVSYFPERKNLSGKSASSSA